MRRLLILVFAAATPAVFAAVTQQDIERSVFQRLEVIDFSRVLSNKRILSKYLRCMLRQGVCPPEARDFRRTIPTILRNLCDNCTMRQRKSLQMIFSFVKEKFPEDWENLLKLYDPNRDARERLEKFIIT